MKYVTKTTRISDFLATRETRKDRVHPRNEDSLSIYSTFVCSGAITAPKTLSTGKIPFSRERNLLCEIRKVGAAPNSKFFLKCKKILNLLTCAVTPRNHRLNRLPNKMTPAGSPLRKARISSQCNYGLNFYNLTINLTGPVKSYFSLTTAKTMANGNPQPTLIMFHRDFHRASLLSNITEYMRPTGTPAPLNSG